MIAISQLISISIFSSIMYAETEYIVARESVSRGPISIFGPIFKVEDRAEDGDLRRAERNW